MVLQPEIAIILSTFERPGHLRRSLTSLAVQRGVWGRFEVIVTDDGSRDSTPELVARLARRWPFPLRFVTQEHAGFRLARCRNNGVRNSTAPYLLFSDGDCIFPPDHVRQHLRARRRGTARSGSSYWLDRATSSRVDETAIVTGGFPRWVPRHEKRRIDRRWIKDELYRLVGHRCNPKLIGCNLALWRSDFERVNGFDEQFVGWGCEDDDLAERLRRTGVRIATILGHTRSYHLWHPSAPTCPTQWHKGPNVPYHRREDKPVWCRHGLVDSAENAAVEGAAAPRSKPSALRVA